MPDMHRCMKCGENPCPITTTFNEGYIMQTSMAYCDNCFKMKSWKDNGDGTSTIEFGVDDSDEGR